MSESVSKFNKPKAEESRLNLWNSWLIEIQCENRFQAIMDSVIQPLLKKGVKGSPVKFALRQLSSPCTVSLDRLSVEEIKKHTEQERRSESRSTKDDSTSFNFDSSSYKCKTKITKKKYRRLQILSSDSETDNETPDNEKISTNLLSEIHQNIQSNKSNRCYKTECSSKDVKDLKIGTYEMVLKQLRNEDKQNSSSLEKLENLPSNVDSYPVKDILLPKSKQHDHNVSWPDSKNLIPDQDKATDDKNDPLIVSTKSNIDKNLTSCSNKDNRSRVPFDPTYSLSHLHERDKAKENNMSSESSIKTSNNRCCDQRVVSNSPLKMSVSLPNNKLGNVLDISIKSKTKKEETQHELFHSKTNPDLHDTRKKHAKEYDGPKIVKDDTVVTGKGIKCSKENIKDVDPKMNNNVFVKHHQPTKLQVNNRFSSGPMHSKDSLKKESHSADNLNKSLTNKHIKTSTAEKDQNHHSHSFDKTVKKDQKEKENNSECKNNKEKGGNDPKIVGSVQSHRLDKNESIEFDKSGEIIRKDKEKGLKSSSLNHSHKKSNGQIYLNKSYDEKLFKTDHKHKSDLTQKERKCESVEVRTNKSISEKDSVFLSVDRRKSAEDAKKDHITENEKINSKERITLREHDTDKTCNEDKQDTTRKTLEIRTNNSKSNICKMSPEIDPDKKPHLSNKQRVHSEKKTENDSIDKIHKSSHSRKGSNVCDEKPNVCNKEKSSGDTPSELDKSKIDFLKKYSKSDINFTSIKSRKDSRSDGCDEKCNSSVKERDNISGSIKKTTDENKRNDKTTDVPIPSKSKKDYSNEKQHYKKHRKSSTEDKLKDHNRKELHIESNSTVAKNNSSSDRRSSRNNDQNNTNGANIKTTNENIVENKNNDNKKPSSSKPKKTSSSNECNEKHHKNRRKSSGEDKQKETSNETEIHDMITKNNSRFDIHDENQKLSIHTKESSSDNPSAHNKTTDENKSSDKRSNISLSSSKTKQDISTNDGNEKDYCKKRRRSSTEDKQKYHNGKELHKEIKVNNRIEKTTSSSDVHNENLKLPIRINQKRSSNDNEQDNTSGSNERKKETSTNDCNEKHCKKKRKSLEGSNEENDINGSRKRLKIEKFVNNNDCKSDFTKSDNLLCKIINKQRQSSTENNKNEIKIDSRVDKTKSRNNSGSENCDEKSNSYKEFDNKSDKRMKIENIVKSDIPKLKSVTDLGKSPNISKNIENNTKTQSTEITHKTRKDGVSDVSEEKLTYKRSKSSIDEDNEVKNNDFKDNRNNNSSDSNKCSKSPVNVSTDDSYLNTKRRKSEGDDSNHLKISNEERKTQNLDSIVTNKLTCSIKIDSVMKLANTKVHLSPQRRTSTEILTNKEIKRGNIKDIETNCKSKTSITDFSSSTSKLDSKKRQISTPNYINYENTLLHATNVGSCTISQFDSSNATETETTLCNEFVNSVDKSCKSNGGKKRKISEHNLKNSENVSFQINTVVSDSIIEDNLSNNNFEEDTVVNDETISGLYKETKKENLEGNKMDNSTSNTSTPDTLEDESSLNNKEREISTQVLIKEKCLSHLSRADSGLETGSKIRVKETEKVTIVNEINSELDTETICQNNLKNDIDLHKSISEDELCIKETEKQMILNSNINSVLDKATSCLNNLKNDIDLCLKTTRIGLSIKGSAVNIPGERRKNNSNDTKSQESETVKESLIKNQRDSVTRVFNSINDSISSQTEKIKEQNLTQTNDSTSITFVTNTVSVVDPSTVDDSNKQEKDVLPLDVDVNIKSILYTEATDDKIHQNTNSLNSESNTDFSLQDIEKESEILNRPKQVKSGLKVFDLSFDPESTCLPKPKASILRQSISICTKNDTNTLENKENSDTVHRKSTEKQFQNVDLPQVKNYPVDSPTKNDIRKTYEDNVKVVSIAETVTVPNQNSTNIESEASKSPRHSKLPSIVNVKIVESISKEQSPNVCVRNDLNIASNSKDQNLGCRKFSDVRNAFEQKSDSQKNSPKLQHQKNNLLPRENSISNTRKMLPTQSGKNNLKSYNIPKPVNGKGTNQGKFYPNKNLLKSPTTPTKNLINLIGLTAEQVKLIKFKSAHDHSQSPTASKSLNVPRKEQSLDHISKMSKDDKVIYHMNKEDKKKQIYMNLFGEDCDESETVNNTTIKITSTSRKEDEESDCGNKQRADDSCNFVLPNKSGIENQCKMNMKISSISRKEDEESDCENKQRANDSCSSVLPNKSAIEIQNKMNMKISSISRKDNEESNCENKQRANDSCNSVFPNKSGVEIQSKMDMKISSISRKEDEESDCENKQRADDSCSSVLTNKSPIETQNKMNTPSVQFRTVQAPAKTGNKFLNKASIIKVMNQLTADANKFIGKSKSMSMKEKEMECSKEPVNSNEIYNRVLPSMPSIDDSVSIQDFLITLDGESCKVHQDFDSQKACTLYKAPEDTETSDLKTSQTQQLSCTLSIIEGSKVVSDLLISRSSTLPSEPKNIIRVTEEHKDRSSVRKVKKSVVKGVKNKASKIHEIKKVAVDKIFDVQKRNLFSDRNESVSSKIKLGSSTSTKVNTMVEKYISDNNSDNLQSEIPTTVLKNTKNQKQLDSESIIVINESNTEETIGDNKKSDENDSFLDKTEDVKLDICDEAIVSSSTVSPEHVTVCNIETNVSLNDESKIGKIRVKDARELGIPTRDDFCPTQINYLRPLSNSNETFAPCNTFVVVPKESNLFIDGQVTSTVPDISPVIDVVSSSSGSSESLPLNDKDSDVQHVKTLPVDCIVNDASPVQEVNVTVKTCANTKSNTPSSKENCLKIEEVKEESTTDVNMEENMTPVKSDEQLEIVSQHNEQISIETNVPSNRNNTISETLPTNFEQNSLQMSSRTNRSSSQNNEQNYVQSHSSLKVPSIEQNHITNSQSVTYSKPTQIPTQNRLLSTENIEKNRAQETTSSQNTEYGHVLWPPVENLSSNPTNINSTSQKLRLDIYFKYMNNLINSTNGDWTKNNLNCARIYNAVFDNSATLICKLAEMLHLVITYKEAMIPQISKCRKLKSDSLIKNETNRIEKAYQDNVLMRGKDFYSLFREISRKIIINSKNQNFIDLVFILYIKIINDLIKIDTTHKAYEFKVRNIIIEMMTAIGENNSVIFSLFNSEDEQFRRRYTLVKENLLQIYNSEQLKQFLTHTSSVTSTVKSHNTHSDPNQSTVSTYNLNHSQSSSNENQPVTSSPHINDFKDAEFVDLSSPEPLANIEQENVFLECNETIKNANLNHYYGLTDMIDYSSLQLNPNKRRANSDIEHLSNMAHSLSPSRSSRNSNYADITNSNKQNTNISEINLMPSPQSILAGGIVSNTYVPSNNEQMGSNSVNNDYYRSRTSRRNSEPTHVPSSLAFHPPNLLRGISLVENTPLASNNTAPTKIFSTNNVYNNPTNIVSQESSQIQTNTNCRNPNQPIGFLPRLPSTQSHNMSQGSSIQDQNNQFLHPSTTNNTLAYQEWLRRYQQVQMQEQHYRPSSSQMVLQPAEHARQMYSSFNYTNPSSRFGRPSLHPASTQLVRPPMFTAPNQSMYSLPNVQNPQVGFAQTNNVQRSNSVANVPPPRQMCYFPPCNNPATKHCNTCNKVFYCSNECQKKDWKHQHYLTCI